MKKSILEVCAAIVAGIFIRPFRVFYNVFLCTYFSFDQRQLQ